MGKILVIVTHKNDPHNDAVIAQEQFLPEHQVKIVDLTAGEPDYRALLEEIFAADSVQVW